MELIDVLDENRNNTGKILSREEVHKRGLWHKTVHIWVINKKGDILLQKRSPMKKTSPNMWTTSVSGHLSAGDSSIEGAIRELKEETGYNSNYLIKLDEFYQDEGCSQALNRIYLALDCKKVAKQNLDKDEYIKYMTFNLDELEHLVKNKYIMGVNSKLALEKLYEAEILTASVDNALEKAKILNKIFR